MLALKYFGGLRNLSSPLDVGIMTLKIVVVVFCTREDSNVPLCRAQAGREARLGIDRNLPQKLSQNIEKKVIKLEFKCQTVLLCAGQKLSCSTICFSKEVPAKNWAMSGPYPLPSSAPKYVMEELKS